MEDSKDCKVEVYIEGLTTYVLGSKCGETIGDVRKFLNIDPQEKIAFRQTYESLYDDKVITKNMDLWVIPEVKPTTDTKYIEDFNNPTPLFDKKTLLPTYDQAQLDEIHKNVGFIKSLMTEEDLKGITSKFTKKEWEDFFGPVINNLQKQMKNRVYKLMEDKVILEAQIKRLTNNFECPEYTLDQAIEKIRMFDDPNIKKDKIVFEEIEKRLKEGFLYLQKRSEKCLDVFINLYYVIGRGRLIICFITDKSIYKHLYGINDSTTYTYENYKIYSFKEKHNEYSCKMIKAFCSIPYKFIEYIDEKFEKEILYVLQNLSDKIMTEAGYFKEKKFEDDEKEFTIGYMRFVLENRNEVENDILEYGHIEDYDIDSTLEEMWNELSQKEKEKYEDGDMRGYIIFSHEKTNEIKKEFPDMNPSNIVKKINEKWFDLDKYERKKYGKLGEKEKFFSRNKIKELTQEIKKEFTDMKGFDIIQHIYNILEDYIEDEIINKFRTKNKQEIEYIYKKGYKTIDVDLKAFSKGAMKRIANYKDAYGIDENGNMYTMFNDSFSRFELMMKSIPGTYYYPLKENWLEKYTSTGDIEYVNEDTLEITNEPPYENIPEEYN
jgi:hypothetical protein